MAVNIFLALDNDLEARVQKDASLAGRSLEEELRKRLIECSGCDYSPLSPEDIVEDRNSHLILDLRTKPIGKLPD